MDWGLIQLQNWFMNWSVAALAVAFGGGIIASFTPCIYPVLPIVVSYLGYQSAKRGRRVFILAFIYVMGLASTYGMLGVVAILSGKVFGFWAGSKWLYIFVGNVCLVAAFVMLEWIKLPNFFNRSLVSVSSREGLSGAFFMGAASALVMGPCTTPIFGAVLSAATVSENPLQGMLIIFSFSLGIGLPILVFGTFTGFMASLPKSGPWLVKVQKICGIVMLALAQYFFVKAGTLW
ncbi:MAG: cytochrome c biogenesis protein CcdA [Thermodesulforhabdaceae bacterium]